MRKKLSLGLIFALTTLFLTPQTSYAAGGFPGCKPAVDSQGYEMINGSNLSNAMCFVITKVKFNPSLIDLKGNGIVASVEISGSLFSNSTNPDRDPNGLNIYAVSLLRASDNSNTVSENTSDPNCSNFQAVADGLYGKFENLDPGVKYLTQNLKPDQTSVLNGDFTTRIPIYFPPDCSADNYRLAISYNSGSWSGTESLIGVPGNSIKLTSSSKLPVVGTICPKLGLMASAANNVQVVCAKLKDRLIWGAISSTTQNATPSKAPNQKVSATKAKAATPKPGTICPVPGSISGSGSSSLVCAKKSGKNIWISMNTESSTNPSPSSPPVETAADRYKSQGCSTFPGAIVNFVNHSNFGDPFRGSAFIAAQNAAGYFLNAKLADSAKYSSLYNVVGLIIEYAQASTMGGSGRISASTYEFNQALATFNSICGSSLSIN
jgi:hypothetical protein